MIPDCSASQEVFDETQKALTNHQNRLFVIVRSIQIKIAEIEVGITGNELDNETLFLISQFNAAMHDIEESQEVMIKTIHDISESFNELLKIASHFNSKSVVIDHNLYPKNSNRNLKIANINFEKYLLPKGFIWVNLDFIDSNELLEGFNQQKFLVINNEDWFNKLRNVVLPALNEQPLRGKDYFHRIDQKLGLSYPNGYQKIYERFFGDEHITLSKTPGAPYYSVTNGIHRIFIAKQLRWRAIPAKVI